MQAAKQGSSQLSEAELEQRRNAARARWAGHTPAAKAVMSYDLEKVSYRSVIGGLRSLYGRGANAAGRLGNRAGRFMEENTKAGQARLGLSRRNSAVAAAMGRQAKEAKESAVFYERELATVGSDPVNYLRRYSQQHIMQAPIRQRNRAKLSVLHSINAAYNAGEKTGTQAALNAAGRKGERAGRAAYHAGAAATGAAAIGGAAYGATQLSEAQREQRRNAAKARWAKYGGGSGR